MSQTEALATIESALGVNEKVVWFGRPTQRLAQITAGGIIAVCFLTVIVAPVLVQNFGQFSTSKRLFVSTSLLLLGLRTLGPQIVSYYHRSNLFYAVTNRRAFIFSSASGRLRERLLNWDTSLDYAPGKKATIRFEKTPLSKASLGRSLIWPTRQYDFEFYMVAEGDHVMEILRKAMRGEQ